MIFVNIEPEKNGTCLMSQLDCCLFAFPFWLANAAPESAESPFTGDYMHVPHYAALGLSSPLVVGACPPPFFVFYF